MRGIPDVDKVDSKTVLVPAYVTAKGRAYHADALEVLRRLPDDSVALVLTSPPFALQRKKAYGNVAAADYVEWLWPFAKEIHRVLQPDGSFVLELGGAWNHGSGTRSLYQYDVLIRLASLYHLAQDFYWYNPSRLPTPAEWVTIRRTRVKDAVNLIWWLSKTDTPKADNRRVLRPYSPSMKRLLKNGYKAARRPSQHDISENFSRDNGGAIPPNLLTIPNTRSNDEYLTRCREAGLPIHPARFPPPVPEFFIRFLTEAGQLVLDPFAGSNVVGQVAESLERSWISVEIKREYVEGSRLRFPLAVASSGRSDSLAG
jgi:DNA modification methylase